MCYFIEDQVSTFVSDGVWRLYTLVLDTVVVVDVEVVVEVVVEVDMLSSTLPVDVQFIAFYVIE